MAIIECNEINQTINELLTAFQDCKTIKNTDLIRLVELVQAVNICANGGANYSDTVEVLYQPLTDLIVSYPVDTFHALSINVIDGAIEKLVGVDTVRFPANSSLYLEVTTLNQTVYDFKVIAGSKVYVEYIIETV